MATAAKQDLDKSGAYDDNNRNQDKSGIDPMLENAEQAFMKAGEFEKLADELTTHHLKSIAETLHDPTLKDDDMYIKLMSRITAFFSKVENDRRKSRTDSAVKNKTSGVPLS
jgi:hypothetical protein